MIIAQISDSHIDLESERLGDRLRDLQCVIRDINNLVPAPNLVIHTGDVVHNGTQLKYELALTILELLQVPLYVCAGNRDDKNLIAENFETAHNTSLPLEFLQYSIDHYPVRLIALDTTSTITNMGDYCQERADTLGRMLSEEPHKPTVLFMHHPPFKIKESKYPYQFDDWNTVEYLARVLIENGQVKHLFCGHTHRNSIGELLGIPASTTPSIATDLRVGDGSKNAQSSPSYQIHEFDGSGFKSKTIECKI